MPMNTTFDVSPKPLYTTRKTRKESRSTPFLPSLSERYPAGYDASAATRLNSAWMKIVVVRDAPRSFVLGIRKELLRQPHDHPLLRVPRVHPSRAAHDGAGRPHHVVPAPRRHPAVGTQTRGSQGLHRVLLAAPAHLRPHLRVRGDRGPRVPQHPAPRCSARRARPIRRRSTWRGPSGTSCGCSSS